MNKDQSGGSFNDPYPAWCDSCHFFTTDEEPDGTNQTDGGVLADLFIEPTDETSADFFKAKPGGALDNRTTATNIGWPYDIEGNAWADGDPIGAFSEIGGGGTTIALGVGSVAITGNAIGVTGTRTIGLGAGSVVISGKSLTVTGAEDAAPGSGRNGRAYRHGRYWDVERF
jgi:hypothetical protein